MLLMSGESISASFRLNQLKCESIMSSTSGFFLLMQFGLILSALPPLPKCSLSDSNCIRSSAQAAVSIFTAGIPELGTEVLDPMQVDSIKVDLSGLKLNIKDAVIKGMRNSVIDSLSIDMAKKQMQLVFHSDFSMRGKYKASGKLLILPISGDGDTHMKINNCQIVMDMAYDISKNKDGKDTISLKSYKYRFDVRDGAHFQLTNLFNGNKPLSDTLHTFMNGNWKTMTMEFGNPIFDKPVQKIYNSTKTYLDTMPLEEIANV